MNGESARLGALPNHTHSHPSRLAGRALVHLRSGDTFSGWVKLGGGAATIGDRLRTSTGPSYRQTYIYRETVKRTYPVRAVGRIHGLEPPE